MPEPEVILAIALLFSVLVSASWSRVARRWKGRALEAESLLIVREADLKSVRRAMYRKAVKMREAKESGWLLLYGERFVREAPSDG